MTKRSKRPKSAKLASAKRLSSEDFLKKFDEMWQPGPTVKYRHPDSW
jgi:hypothetical protein